MLGFAVTVPCGLVAIALSTGWVEPSPGQQKRFDAREAVDPAFTVGEAAASLRRRGPSPVSSRARVH